MSLSNRWICFCRERVIKSPSKYYQSIQLKRSIGYNLDVKIYNKEEKERKDFTKQNNFLRYKPVSAHGGLFPRTLTPHRHSQPLSFLDLIRVWSSQVIRIQIYRLTNYQYVQLYTLQSSVKKRRV